MPDKILTCKDCGQQFVFSEGEQAFYAEKGFQNEPQRCQECRKVRKQQRKSSMSFDSRNKGISNRW